MIYYDCTNINYSILRALNDCDFARVCFVALAVVMTENRQDKMISSLIGFLEFCLIFISPRTTIYEI